MEKIKTNYIMALLKWKRIENRNETEEINLKQKEEED